LDTKYQTKWHFQTNESYLTFYLDVFVPNTFEKRKGSKRSKKFSDFSVNIVGNKSFIKNKIHFITFYLAE